MIRKRLNECLHPAFDERRVCGDGLGWRRKHNRSFAHLRLWPTLVS